VVFNATQELLHEGYTDAQGKLTCAVPLNTTIYVTATHPEAVEQTFEFRVNQPSHTFELVLPPLPNLSIQGRVVNAEGTPVTNAYLTLWNVATGELRYTSRSAASGAFAFHKLSAKSYLIQATHSDYLAGEVQCQGGSSEVIVILAKRAEIAVRTVDERGNRVEGAEITLDNPGSNQGIITRLTVSDIRGSASFDNLLPDRYRLRLNQLRQQSMPPPKPGITLRLPLREKPFNCLAASSTRLVELVYLVPRCFCSI